MLANTRKGTETSRKHSLFNCIKMQHADIVNNAHNSGRPVLKKDMVGLENRTEGQPRWSGVWHASMQGGTEKTSSVQLGKEMIEKGMVEVCKIRSGVEKVNRELTVSHNTRTMGYLLKWPGSRFTNKPKQVIFFFLHNLKCTCETHWHKMLWRQIV